MEQRPTTTPSDESGLRLFEMAKAFPERRLAEPDRARRERLYAEFYGRFAGFAQAHKHRPRLLDLFCPNKVVLFAGKG